MNDKVLLSDTSFKDYSIKELKQKLSNVRNAVRGKIFIELCKRDLENEDLKKFLFDEITQKNNVEGKVFGPISVSFIIILSLWHFGDNTIKDFLIKVINSWTKNRWALISYLESEGVDVTLFDDK